MPLAKDTSFMKNQAMLGTLPAYLMRVMGNAYDIGSAFDPKAAAEYGKTRGAGGITTDLVNSLLPSVQVDDPTKGIQSGVSGKTPEAPTGNPILDAFHNAGHLVGGANVAPSALDGLAGAGAALHGTEGAANQMNMLVNPYVGNPVNMKMLPEYTRLRQEIAQLPPELQPGKGDHYAIAQYLWDNTGWDTPGADLVPRTEISDAKASANRTLFNYVSNPSNKDLNIPLEGILSHPELFKAEPRLRNINTVLRPNEDGAFIRTNDVGDILEMSLGGLRTPRAINRGYDPYEEFMGSVLHETQHALDKLTTPDILGGGSHRLASTGYSWPTVGYSALQQNDPSLSINDAVKEYGRSVAETLARNTELRRELAVGTRTYGKDGWRNAFGDNNLVYPDLTQSGVAADRGNLGPITTKSAPTRTSPVSLEDQVLFYLFPRGQVFQTMQGAANSKVIQIPLEAQRHKYLNPVPQP